MAGAGDPPAGSARSGGGRQRRMMPVATPLYSFYWVAAHFVIDVPSFHYLGSRRCIGESGVFFPHKAAALAESDQARHSTRSNYVRAEICTHGPRSRTSLKSI
jgi:uncharacterized protein (DUF1684 family)